VDQATRQAVEDAHDPAVGSTLGWIERQAAFTRTGLVAAAFDHRQSRSGDPDLHTHLAVGNKVCLPDGRWRSLDAPVLPPNPHGPARRDKRGGSSSWRHDQNTNLHGVAKLHRTAGLHALDWRRKPDPHRDQDCLTTTQCTANPGVRSGENQLGSCATQ
jgi:hypothetical protein